MFCRSTSSLIEASEGLQALSSSGGLVGEGGSPRGNTKLAGQGLQALSLLPDRTIPWSGPGQVHGSGTGLVAPGGGRELLHSLLTSITQQNLQTIQPPDQKAQDTNEPDQAYCDQSVLVRGVCGCKEKTEHWLILPCKRRTCPICGKARRRRIAQRICQGIEAQGSAGYFVGTWNRDTPKKEAVLTGQKFIRWLRTKGGQSRSMEYASTWETTRRGRLHLNLVLAPWNYIPQKVLSERWQRYGGGRVVWIQRVDATIAAEVAKVSNYFAKNEQMVLTGRGACYSEGWPKLAKPQAIPRKGVITWQAERFWGVEGYEFRVELGFDLWKPVSPCEYSRVEQEKCSCFQPLDGCLTDPGG